LSKPNCSGFKIKINNTNCTRECTEKHEGQHEKDLKPCCDKGREKWADVAKKYIDSAYVRTNGLTGKSLAKASKDVDKEKKVVQQRAVISQQWSTYGEGARDWTECNADQVSIKCADDLWKRYKCDCPTPKTKKCCQDIEHYRNMAKERSKARKCPEGGQPPMQPPQCPF
jgi:hypothetical protein